MVELSELKLVNAQASSSVKDGKAANVLEKKDDLMWQAKGEGEYITVDLGEPEKVSRLSVKWFDADVRKQTYELQSSNDGKTFKRIGEVVSSGNANNEFEEHDFERPIEARYFRIINLGNTLNSFASIISIKAFGPKKPDEVKADTAPPVTHEAPTLTVGDTARGEVVNVDPNAETVKDNKDSKKK